MAAQFLSEAISCEEPQTLLLFSDEPTDWMTGSPDFAAKWAALMMQTIARGHRIKVIHTVSRDLDEMLRAIGQWMPLYTSGSIEPYFYPKKRDGLFKNTLFIAPGNGAVVSSCIGPVQDQAVFLFRNKRTVAAYTEEFLQLLALCKPLMRIFLAQEQEAFLDMLLDFEQDQTNTFVETPSLSILTMPENVARAMILRQGGKLDNPFFGRYERRVQYFAQAMQACSYTEIIGLPDITEIIGGEARPAFSGMLDTVPLYYTPQEYILHLENIIRFLETYENYHICILDQIHKNNYLVYAKEDVGVLVASLTAPPLVMVMTEANITVAFWDFLKNQSGSNIQNAWGNKRSAERLRDFIREIKSGLQ